MALVLGLTGCQGTTATVRQTDSTLQRHARRAAEAFAEGELEQAIAGYRRAVRRAWGMDDPYESGTAAYNLAACFTTDGRWLEAKDWLLDARVEFQRAGVSAGNVWLLEAKIAKHETRFEDVHYLLQRAACCEPPCPDQVRDGLCGDEDPCKEGCVASIPCLGPRLAQRKSVKDCQRSYEAQIHLLRARVAAEQYDIGVAQRELGCACSLAADVCSYDLHAELHDVAALIHIAKGEYLQAARHLDQEAVKLRWAGNYREIPSVLELASAAYEQAGLIDLAADRLVRVARVLYGRGDLRGSWRYVELAIPLADSASTETAKVRLSLLANELLLAFSEQGESVPELPDEPDESLGMIGPANAWSPEDR